MDDAPEPEPASSTSGSTPPGGSGKPRTSKGSGRQNLADANDYPVERVELFDEALEGVAPRAGFEESYMLGYRRASAVRILIARAKYRTTQPDGDVTVVTVPKPRELYDRGMLAPSFIAHLLAKKYRWGMPFHRAARELLADGIRLDDSTMCRYAEHVGASLGGIVDACVDDALENAFCLSTDATGVAIQPTPLADGRRARRGTYSSSSPTRITCFSNISPSTRARQSARCCTALRAISRPTRMPCTTPCSEARRVPTGTTSRPTRSVAGPTREGSSGRPR